MIDDTIQCTNEMWKKKITPIFYSLWINNISKSIEFYGLLNFLILQPKVPSKHKTKNIKTLYI
jgi:hypothetical protein